MVHSNHPSNYALLSLTLGVPVLKVAGLLNSVIDVAIEERKKEVTVVIVELKLQERPTENQPAMSIAKYAIE